MEVKSKPTINIIFIISIIVVVGILLYQPFRNTENANPIIHPRGEQFAGDQTCATCHTQIHKDFNESGHNRSSAVASTHSVLGSFQEGGNEISFPNSARFLMEQADSGLYQTGFRGDQKISSQRIDVVIGSGIRGQTYLHWEGDKLIQLPVSYNSQEKNWVPVPGSSFDRYMFRRQIGSGCMNCHSTHMEENLALQENPGFDKTKMILGISCERCHGPSQNHVDLMNDGKTKESLLVRNPRKMNRKQQLDLCAQCHSSRRNNQLLPFHFLPGDSLYSTLNASTGAPTAEVHGNQFDLLAVSKCFLNSDMTCSTCHSPHQNERGLIEPFSTKCMNCHQKNTDTFCSLKSVPTEVLTKDCISCHMPVRNSKVITFDNQNAGKRTAEIARSHFISINLEEAKAIVQLLKEQSR